MKITPRFCATAAALSALVLLAGSPRSAAASLIPGTPLNGVNVGGSGVVAGTTAIVGGNPYSEIGDISDANMAVPGDVVILAQITGNTAVDDNPANWLAVARFFSPADPDGSKGTDATEEIGFLSTASPLGSATDFSTFTLFPNVVYSPVYVGQMLPSSVITTTITEFGPAGAITSGQTATLLMTVDGIGVPEPATAALLGIGATLLLSRRRRTLDGVVRAK